MKLGVKLLREGAQMPSYAKPGDAGMDVRLWVEPLGRPRKLMLRPGQTVKARTGLAFDIPDGFELQVRPRSGLSKDGLLVHFGTVDSGYRGEVAICVTNVNRTSFFITHGDRIAQLVLAPVVRAELEQVEELSETERGTAGFGSTGRG